MSTIRRNRNRRMDRRKFRRGSKVEIVRKPVPRISTLNKKIKRLEDSIELKYFDTVFFNTIDNTGELHLINGMASGATQITRVGAEIEATSVQFRFAIDTNPQNVGGCQRVRMILFWDSQPNGAAPTLAGDPLSGGGAGALLNNGTITQLVYAPYQYENQERFRILYDKIFVLNPRFWQEHDNSTPTAITEVYPIGVSGKKKIKLGRKVKYDATLASITAINKNSLYMAYVSTEPANAPTVYCGFRLYFKDA